MGALVEESLKSGALLATEGCMPSAKGARVRLSAGKYTVKDGPFTEYQRADRRLRLAADQFQGRSDRTSQALSRSRGRRRNGDTPGVRTVRLRRLRRNQLLERKHLELGRGRSSHARIDSFCSADHSGIDPEFRTALGSLR